MTNEYEDFRIVEPYSKPEKNIAKLKRKDEKVISYSYHLISNLLPTYNNYNFRQNIALL